MVLQCKGSKGFESCSFLVVSGFFLGVYGTVIVRV